jgi:hypothetical protein
MPATGKIAPQQTGAEAHAPITVVLAHPGDVWQLQIERAGTEPHTFGAAPLPATFDPTDWHTLRLTLQQRLLTVSLDGPDRLAIQVPDTAYTRGLFTAQAGCAFMRVWQTGLPLGTNPA